MNLWMIMKLCVCFTLCDRVRSSQCSILQNQMLLNDKINDFLGKFFLEFKRTYLEELMLRHITIVGATADYLHRVQPLIQNYPSIICKDTRKCDYRDQFSRGNFVIIFLDDFRKNTFVNNVELMSRCRRCRILFVSDDILRVEEILLIFTVQAVQENLQYAAFAHIEDNGIQIYRNFIAKNCSMGIRQLISWRPGLCLQKVNFWAFKIRDLNRCPVVVSSLTFTPKMIIKEDENGRLTIAGGRDGRLLLALATKLNFTINLRYPSVADQMKNSRKVAIIHDVAFGTSEIGVGRLRPTKDLYDKIAISFPYDEECVTWAVPRVIDWSNDIVWLEFSREVWISVGLIFAICCVVGYLHRSIISLKNGEQTHQGFVTILLDAIAMHLGNPVVYVSSSAGGRFLLVAFLYYAMVITTAYKTSLASILTTDEGTPRIVDAQGIINANLNVGGSLYDYNILLDQVGESELTSKLLHRFVVNNNDIETWYQLIFDHDYAFLARRSSLHYERQKILKAHESVTFDVFNSCALAYHTVIVFPKSSLLRKPVDGIILHLAESGILQHWDNDEFNTYEILKHKSAENFFENRASYKFRYIFIFYSGCIAFCLLTFFTELLIKKLN